MSSRSGRSTASTTSSASAGSPSAVHSTRALLDVAAGRAARRRPGGAPPRAAAARRGGGTRRRRSGRPVAVVRRRGRARGTMPTSPSGARWRRGRRARAREQRGADRYGRWAASASSSRSGAVDAGEHLLGEVLEEDGVRREQAIEQRPAVDRPGAPQQLGSQSHGERPSARRAHDLLDRLLGSGGRARDRRCRRRVIARSDADTRAISPAARRRAMRNAGACRHASTRCSRGGRCSTSASRKSLQRIVDRRRRRRRAGRACPR